MTTERRRIRSVIEHHTDLTQDSIDYLSDLIIAIVNETRGHKVESGAPDRMYRAITGQFMIPNDTRRQTNLEVIGNMISELGEEETASRLNKAWAKWGASKSTRGTQYNKLNTSWIDWAMIDEEEAQPVQANSDGSLNV